MAHITGGGLVDNVPRVLGRCDAWIDRASWPMPGLFRLLTGDGRVEREEAYHVLNMGIGMVLIVDRDAAPAVKAELESRGETVYEIGRTEAAREAGEGKVRWIS
jgi:phosphoribosylaminoimidazole (AIR) synthetase